jgi:probable phosphomutase (TIGR03848 family)
VILLIRHAENDYVQNGRLAGRLPGVHLNEKGRTQAQELSLTISEIPIKAIYSSPLERAFETATILAERIQLQVETRDGLMEVNFGEWQGRKIKELERLILWKIVHDNPGRMCFPGGETFCEAQLRIVNEIEGLVRLYTGNEIILCVSHSDVIKLAIAYYIGLHIDLFQRLLISPASLSALKFDETICQLLFLNQVDVFTLPTN